MQVCSTCGMDLGPGVGLEGLCPRCLFETAGEEPRSLESLFGRVVDNKYRVDRLLGRGGMGAVFLATHLGTERSVALKVLAPHLVDDEEFVERFRCEARAAGRLRHPNIVNVTDFGIAEADDGPLAYLVMEYLVGGRRGGLAQARLPGESVFRRHRVRGVRAVDRVRRPSGEEAPAA